MQQITSTVMNFGTPLKMATGDDELAPFKLEHVEGLEAGEKKGHGAYGTVYKVTVNGVPCIAKRIHDILVNEDIVSLREKEAAQQKFRQECLILCKLRHPNIVHFIGVHYRRDRNDLSLVMECLHTDLGKCVETHPNIPLSIKLAILLDVSYGLLYLHTILPPNGPIIHRDLSAGNILLSSDMRAKIGDLGVSKLLNRRAQTAIAHTKAPGTPDYMPPEALKELPKYDSKLDLFSFGHLTLYTVNQEIPDVFEVTRIHAIADIQQGTYEIRRRRIALDKMGEEHCLYELTTRCLQDNPENRPSTQELNIAFKELCAKHPKTAEDLMQAMGTQIMEKLSSLEKASSELSKMQLHAKEQSRKMLELKQKLQAFEVGKEEEQTSTKETLYILQDEIQRLTDEQQAVRRDKQSLQEELDSTEAQNKELVAEVQMLEQENRKLHDNIKKLSQLSVQDAQMQKDFDEQLALLSALQKEKEDLHEELQAAKAEALVYKADFEAEREDRAQAFGKMDDLRTEHVKTTEMLHSDLRMVEVELEHHKQLLLEAKRQKTEKDLKQESQKREKELKQQLQDARKEIEKREKECKQQLKDAKQESQKREKELKHEVEEFQQEVQAKTSQVKQYKKQVDTLKDQNAQLEKHNSNWIEAMKQVRWELEKTRNVPKKSKKTMTEIAGASKAALVMKVAELEGLSEGLRSESDALHEENDRLLEEVAALQRTGSDLRKLLRDSMGTPPELPPKPKKGTDSRSPSVSPMISPQGRQLDSHIASTPESNVTPLSEQMQALHIKEQEEMRHQLQQQFQAEKAHQQQALQMHVSLGVREEIPEPQAPVSDPHALAAATLQSSQQSQSGQPLRSDKHVVSTVREDSSHRVTQKHIPYDPNLVCPYCTKQFRMGEIQYFKRHVGSCTGSDPGTVREDSSDRVTQKHIPYDPNLVCPYCTKQFRIGEIQYFKRHVGSCTGSDPVV